MKVIPRMAMTRFWRGRLLILFLSSTMTTMAFSSAWSTPPIKDSAQAVRRIVSSRSCAQCHTPGLPTTRKGALQVFDLSRDDWFARMSRRQLESFQARLFTALSPEEAREVGGTKPDPALTPEEKSFILSFVVDRGSRP
jgi:hypothetical protein